MSAAEIFDTLREAAPELRRPFTAKALQWKVQTQWGGGRDEPPTGGMIVCYIDRPLVVDRLNVLVPHLWSARFTDIENPRNHTICALTIDGITREDVGEGATLKARRSDALKRAAVHFGIGVCLARVPKSRLHTNDGNLSARWYISRGERKWALEITQKGLDYLRARYDGWLQQVGKETFGDPLNHGDLGEAQGDDDLPDDIAAASAAEVRVALYQRLTNATTLRQQRGYLAAAGVTGLAEAMTPEAVEHAVSGLTDEEAERLDTLLAAKQNGGDRER